MTTTKVTIDDLAVMVAKGFKETNDNLVSFKAETINKFREINEKFKETNDNIGRLAQRFDELEDTVANNHGHRLRRIESKLQLA
jgi:uncharacterized coiled-coil DUF342 family protein